MFKLEKNASQNLCSLFFKAYTKSVLLHCKPELFNAKPFHSLSGKQAHLLTQTQNWTQQPSQLLYSNSSIQVLISENCIQLICYYQFIFMYKVMALFHKKAKMKCIT